MLNLYPVFFLSGADEEQKYDLTSIKRSNVRSTDQLWVLFMSIIFITYTPCSNNPKFWLVRE